MMILHTEAARFLFAITGIILVVAGITRLARRRVEQMPPETASGLFTALSGAALLVEAGIQSNGAFGLVGWVMLVSAWMAAQFGNDTPT